MIISYRRTDLLDQISDENSLEFSVTFEQDMSLAPSYQFEIKNVALVNPENQEDENNDAALEWLSEYCDELFIPIKEQRTNTRISVTSQDAKQYVDFMKERLSQNPRITVHPKQETEVTHVDPTDNTGISQDITEYTIYLNLKPNRG